MDLTCKPTSCDANGYFAEIYDTATMALQLVIVSRAYPQPDGSWATKVLPGDHACQRVQGQLHSGGPFTTFQIVTPGHWGILWHIGNWATDSDGCYVCGTHSGVINGVPAVYETMPAFAKFMALQQGCDSFTLTVLPL